MRIRLSVIMFFLLAIFLGGIGMYLQTSRVVLAHSSTDCGGGSCGPDPDDPTVVRDIARECEIDPLGNCRVYDYRRMTLHCEKSTCTYISDPFEGETTCRSNACEWKPFHAHCCMGGTGDGDPPVDPCNSNTLMTNRVMLDVNKNGLFDDGFSNWIQRSTHSCGAFATFDGIFVHQEGSSSAPPAWELNNTCPDPDKEPAVSWRPLVNGKGGFDGDVWLSNLPAGYRVVALGGPDANQCNFDPGSGMAFGCNFCKHRRIDFLIQEVTPPPPPPSCSVSGPTNMMVGESGSYSVTPQGEHNLAEIWRTPTSNMSWVNVYSGASGGSGTFTCPAEGTYYVVCNAINTNYTPAPKCTGNPWCEWAPNPPSTLTCNTNASDDGLEGWVDCTGNDTLVVNCSSTPSCSFDISTCEMDPGGTDNLLIVDPAPVNGNINQITWNNSNPAQFSLCETGPCPAGQPASFVDNDLGWGASVTNYAAGASATITATALMDDGVTTCTRIQACNLSNPDPWWQVRGGDIVSTEDIVSDVTSCFSASCEQFLDIGEADPSGSLEMHPGVPIYTGGLKPIAPRISETNWQARASYQGFTTKKGVDYSYNVFNDRVLKKEPILTDEIESVNDLRKGPLVNGEYYVVKRTGNLDFGDDSTVHFGTNKIILFVSENLNIKQKINLQDGRGFFMAIVGGDIIVDPGVGDNPVNVDVSTPDLEGLFFTDRQFITGGGGRQLHVRGSVVAMDEVILQRDLDDNELYPAEYFEYAPDLILNFPPILGEKTIKWTESAP